MAAFVAGLCGFPAFFRVAATLVAIGLAPAFLAAIAAGLAAVFTARRVLSAHPA